MAEPGRSLSDEELFNQPGAGGYSGVPTPAPQAQGMSDDQLFGLTPAGPQPGQATAPSAVPTAQPQVLNDEQLAAQPAQPAPPADWLPAPIRYPWEAVKGTEQGAQQLVAGGIAGGGELNQSAKANYLKWINMVDQLPAGVHPQVPAGHTMFDLDPQSYYGSSPEDKAKIRAGLETDLKGGVAQEPLYQAGRYLEKLGEGYLGRGPGFDKSLYADFFNAAGSMAGGIALSMVPGVGPTLAGSTFVGSGVDQQYQDAISKGATKDQALAAAQWGLVAGSTDLADIALPSFGAPGRIASAFKRLAVRVLKGGVTEATQEGTQQFLQNVIAYNIYNPKQDLSDEVLKNALFGFILGGGMSGAFGHGHEGNPVDIKQLADTYKEYLKNGGKAIDLPAGVSAPNAGSIIRIGELQTSIGSAVSELAGLRKQVNDPRYSQQDRQNADARAQQLEAEIRVNRQELQALQSRPITGANDNAAPAPPEGPLGPEPPPAGPPAGPGDGGGGVAVPPGFPVPANQNVAGAPLAPGQPIQPLAPAVPVDRASALNREIDSAKAQIGFLVETSNSLSPLDPTQWQQKVAIASRIADLDNVITQNQAELDKIAPPVPSEPQPLPAVPGAPQELTQPRDVNQQRADDELFSDTPAPPAGPPSVPQQGGILPPTDISAAMRTHVPGHVPTTVSPVERPVNPQTGAPDPLPSLTAPVLPPPVPPYPNANVRDITMASVPDSAFRIDQATALYNAFKSPTFGNTTVPLVNAGFGPTQIDALQTAGLATNGMMNDDQYSQWVTERANRFARARKAGTKVSDDLLGLSPNVGTVGVDDGLTIPGFLRRTAEPPVVAGPNIPMGIPAEANVVDPRVVAFLGQSTKAIDAATIEQMEENEKARAAAVKNQVNPTPTSIKEEFDAISTNPDMNKQDIAQQLGAKLYGGALDKVAVKEMFQNAFDTVKAVLEDKKTGQGKIDIAMDEKSRTISVRDNGEGMPPSVMGNQFLSVGGTLKRGSRPSGGLGIAKLAVQYAATNVHVVSMRDGMVYEMNTTGPQLYEAQENKKVAPKIFPRRPTQADLAQFPEGRGTLVQITLPETYQDPETFKTEKVHFDSHATSHQVLQNSPLFDNIAVTFNGVPLRNTGNRFPADQYGRMPTIKFAHSDAKIYVSEAELPYGAPEQNLHVLSNGLWQFSLKVSSDPSRYYAKSVPRIFYVDVASNVSPKHAGYPFELNRQGFSPSVKPGFSSLIQYLGLQYQQMELEQDARTFGTLQYYEMDANGKAVVLPKQEIKPTAPPPQTALSVIKPGDKVDIKDDGTIIVNGKVLPPMTPEQMKAFKLNPAVLRVPQNSIRTDATLVHDNHTISDSKLRTTSFSDWAREKHGVRYDQFIGEIGAAFRELRDVVAQVVEPGDKRGAFTDTGPKRWDYSTLRKIGVGISYDPAYRGVSITVPFEAAFVNPLATEYTDPARAAVGLVGTMVHELAHHKERNHDAEFPAEMQRILNNLDVNLKGFNFNEFKHKVARIYVAYHDVFTSLRGDFLGGAFDIKPVGKRFKDTGLGQDLHGRSFIGVDAFGSGTSGASGLREWVNKSETVPQRIPGLSYSNAEVSERPAYVDPVGSLNESANVFAATGAPGVIAVPQQPETTAIRKVLPRVLGAGGYGGNIAASTTGGGGGGVRGPTTTGPSGGGPVGPQLRQMASHADRMNKWYKYMAGISQLVKANMRFVPLLKYYYNVREAHGEEAKIHDAAVRLLKDWRRLGYRPGTQGDKLTQFIDDIANMRYRTPTEISRGIIRHPTPAEFAQLKAKHQIGSEAEQMYGRIKDMFDTFLAVVHRNALEQAQRNIKDPQQLVNRLDAINSQFAEYKKTPYFPFVNFGHHFVRVTDSKGAVVHFETFENRGVLGRFGSRSAMRQQGKKFRELEQQYPKASGYDVKYSTLPEVARPMVGMPSALLSDIKNDPNVKLTPDQKQALDELLYNRQAQGSFGARFRTKQYTPGYSMDFQRAFTKYFFHGAKFYTRQKYGWRMADAIAEARTYQGNKAAAIADYMQDHMSNTVLDYTGDFGWAKGAVFMFALGYVPAAAAQNLSQTPMVTTPFLMAKFGDVAGPKAVLKALAQLRSYYKKGTYDNMSDFEARAMSYGIKNGYISETQAPAIAGLSQGNNLAQGIGGNVAQRGWIHFMEKGSWMFEQAEQFNRRIAWRAALDLAMQRPNSKFVKDSINIAAEEYDGLIKGTTIPGQTFSPTQAAAIVTAANAVNQTQFIYARYDRPRFMRGKAGVFTVFKKYIQSVLFLLGQNKRDVLPRYMIVATALGGVGGIPLYDDFKSMLQTLAYYLFGKHFNLDQEVRKYVTQFANGTIDPDLVLHGLARRGFGIPGLIDMMGNNPGRGLRATRAQNVPFPMIDRSKALSMGSALPFDVFKMMRPTADVEKEIASDAQQASGAILSVGFNLYKALQDQNNAWTDRKRWENVMPRALANISKSYRAFDEGRERAKGGVTSAATLVKYDTRDTEQMMEAFALALGYNNLRQQAKWDTILAEQEVIKYYDLEKNGLLSQLYEAGFSRDKEQIKSVMDSIHKFNADLPKEFKARSITSDMIDRSIETHQRDRALKERGLPPQLTNVPIARYMEKLFPEAKTMEIKKVTQ